MKMHFKIFFKKKVLTNPLRCYQKNKTNKKTLHFYPEGQNATLSSTVFLGQYDGWLQRTTSFQFYESEHFTSTEII
jgi:hypothetical protein